MKLRKIGAVLAGAALLGATLAGAVAAQDVPPHDFFIDPETGQPNMVIVVGSGAAAMDVVSATMLAAKVGTMTFTEKPGEVTFTKTYKAVHENINPIISWGYLLAPWIGGPVGPTELWAVGFPTVDVPDAGPYLGWEMNPTPINYTLASLWYFDDYYNAVWGNADEHFQPWETHEEIQIRFDDFYNTQTDMFLEYSDCVACLYGGDIDLDNKWDYQAFQNLWAWYAIPGLIYRADNIFVPPQIGCIMSWNDPAGTQIIDLDYERTRTFWVPDPYYVYYEMMPQFKLFNTIYTPITAGEILDVNFRTGVYGARFGMPYLVTGTPYYEPQIYLYKHDPMNFGPYTVELMDADVDHNKAWFEISKDGELLESFWMVLDPEHGFSPNLQMMGEKDEFYAYDYNDDGIPDYYNKWIVGRAEKDVWAQRQWELYTDNRGDTWGLFWVPMFVIDGVKVFIGAQGTIGIEIKVYWLEDKKAWYNHLCCDPWVTEPNNYQLFIDAYESGWDLVDANNYYVYQPPGTGLWPQAGLAWWTVMVGNGMFIGNGFLDNNDGHLGYEFNLMGLGVFPEANDLDRDGANTNDCRFSDGSWNLQCIDLYDIEDPWPWFGFGELVLELNVALCDKMCAPGCEYKWPIPGPYPRDPPYFTIEVTDVLFTCADGDGINYDTIMEEVQTTGYTEILPADIDETALVMLDTELDFAGWKAACDYNLVLIGGPVANIIVKQLVDEGKSAVNWATSPGEWEYIVAPYGGCDVLIIAGMDRDATRSAAQDLIDLL
jgi:hypothetical protein